MRNNKSRIMKNPGAKKLLLQFFERMRMKLKNEKYFFD
jgi:hypothetical protein